MKGPRKYYLYGALPAPQMKGPRKYYLYGALPAPQMKGPRKYYLYGALPASQMKGPRKYYLYGALPAPQMKGPRKYHLYGSLPGPQMKGPRQYHLCGALPAPQMKGPRKYHLYGSLPGLQMKGPRKYHLYAADTPTNSSVELAEKLTNSGVAVFLASTVRRDEPADEPALRVAVPRTTENNCPPLHQRSDSQNGRRAWRYVAPLPSLNEGYRHKKSGNEGKTVAVFVSSTMDRRSRSPRRRDSSKKSSGKMRSTSGSPDGRQQQESDPPFLSDLGVSDDQTTPTPAVNSLLYDIFKDVPFK
ncbi:hypothetical protein Bbelb_227500 [Branchiostoma belcheri]|nr:hypothetical protein Bbelb_227500 [Branchiostoma belcheri]